ncbi:MAG: LysR family transcriptional regulator [Planctomycetales bacterium]
MHLRFVEIFCDVAQRRSFSKGAAAHAVSQSSASQAVHCLEERLGTKLIDRSKRPLELTPAGRVYYDGCRELLQRFRAIEDQVQTFQDRVTGTVRVAAIYSVGLMQMERSVQRFAELYPDAKLRLEYLHPDQVYQQLHEEGADLGLVSFPRNGGDLISVPWQEQPMVLVVPPTHRLAGAGRIAVGELDGEDYVGFNRNLSIRREVDRWLKRARVTVHVVHEFDNIETIKRAIEIGSGVALLPRPTVWQEISSGTLVALPLTDAHWVRPLGIVHKRNKRLTAAEQKFIDLLLQDAGAEKSTTERSVDGSPKNGSPTRGVEGATSQAPRVAGRHPGRRKKRAAV